MDLRTLNHQVLYLLVLMGVGVAVWAWLARRGFVRSHASIATGLDLDDLKRLAKTDMYLSLAIISLALAIVAAAVIAHCNSNLSEYELRGLLLLGPFCTVLGVIINAESNKVRSLPVEDEALQAEVTHVLATWKSKMLPDW
ncbi:MAG TPA: hypothetical protein VGP63_01710 [Planctomycetaceae bacterium]|nr:hypothetical protein [Planctomycetaceae bacterium]